MTYKIKKIILIHENNMMVILPIIKFHHNLPNLKHHENESLPIIHKFLCKICNISPMFTQRDLSLKL